jgi:putative membrane protein
MKSAFRIMIYPIFFLLAVFTFSSCQNSNNADSKEMAEDQNEQKFDSKVAEHNAQLMVDLVSGQYYEIRLSRYAVQKSTNPEVKNIAEMMITDHTNLLDKLKSLAAEKSISLPNEDSTDVNKKIDDLKDKKPMDFDKAWTDAMIDKHKGTVDKIQNAVDDKDTDADIKALLNNTLPTVRMHLDHLNACKDKLDQAKS